MITDNQIYTYVKNKLTTEYPSIYVTGERLNVSERFPCVSIVSIDDRPISETLDFTESNRRSTFDVNVYTNTSLVDAKDIMNCVRSAFKECMYRCKVCEPLDNLNDTKIKRYVGRYSRAIGKGDTL